MTPPAALANDHLAPGARLGRYEIVQLLALGGMAELYLARSRGPHGFEKLVVLKRVPPYYAQNEEFVSMFIDEARLVGWLRHPNIAQVYEIDTDAGSHFLAMEYVEGRNLGQILARLQEDKRKMSLDHALAIALDVAAGLHAAHESRGSDGKWLSIVHRDVSPANVIIGFDGCVKLVDFGIAKAERRRTRTHAGIIKGKYAYMSPEQCRGETLDRRSDLFSLGIVLYEMTTSTRLFTGQNQHQVLGRLLKAPIPPPSTRRADYPPELARIVMRALERDPDRRYPTAEALHRDAARFARVARLSTSPFDLSDFMLRLFPRRAPTTQSNFPTRPGHADDEPTGQVEIEPRGKVVRGARRKTEQRVAAIEGAHEIAGEVEVESSLDQTDPVIRRRPVARRA